MTRKSLELGIGLWGMPAWTAGDFDAVADLVAQAEASGTDMFFTPDHVAMAAAAGEDDRRSQRPGPLEYPVYEPIAVLPAIAMRTRTIRLGTSIMQTPLRSVALLAKQLATIDVISKGRVELGAGVGWQKEEYEVSGVDFDRRFGLMVEQVEACRRLWVDSPASFRGERITFERLYSSPQPYRRSSIPVWFGIAPTDRNIDRIARHADGWLPLENDPAKVAVHVAAIREAFGKYGRDPRLLRVRSNPAKARNADGTVDLAQTLSSIPALADAGATMIYLKAADFCRTDDDYGLLLEAMSDARRAYVGMDKAKGIS